MALLSWATSAVATPQETYLFVAEATPKEERLLLGDAVLNYVKTDAVDDESIVVVETPRHEHVVTLHVPAGSKNARLRRADFKASLGQFAAWLSRSPGTSDQLTLYGVPETIASLRGNSGGPCRIVLVGSPVFHDDLHAGWDMVSGDGIGLVPTDGTLLPGSGSPFAPGLVSLPRGTAATWITPASLWGARGSKDHRQGLMRYYRLWFQCQNDSLLARFSPSMDYAFDFTPEAGRVVLHPRADGAAMQLVNDATVAAALDVPRPAEVAVVPDRIPPVPPKESKLPGQIWGKFRNEFPRRRQLVIVRLRYRADESPDTSTDVDVRLVEDATGREVWFKEPRVNGLGELQNDIRSGTDTTGVSPTFGDNYEILVVADDVDPAGLTVWINKFVGVGEVPAELSLIVKGKIVATRVITFATPEGDLGQDAGARAASPNWVRVPLSELMSQQAAATASR
ncbi:MAG: hypothetical protein CMJ58_15165 [Planctomycetaceae bacterium]|nr:hypothetical protein [Planctomycetaceae bacterium]